MTIVHSSVVGLIPIFASIGLSIQWFSLYKSSY
jgi:hypothetical protein